MVQSQGEHYKSIFKCRLCEQLFELDNDDPLSIIIQNQNKTIEEYEISTKDPIETLPNINVIHDCGGDGFYGLADLVGFKKIEKEK